VVIGSDPTPTDVTLLALHRASRRSLPKSAVPGRSGPIYKEPDAA
jgi:hypothetical protein